MCIVSCNELGTNLKFLVFLTSVAEPELVPEPVELKLFRGAGAGTGAVISNFGSGSAVLEPKLSF